MNLKVKEIQLFMGRREYVLIWKWRHSRENTLVTPILPIYFFFHC